MALSQLPQLMSIFAAQGLNPATVIAMRIDVRSDAKLLLPSGKKMNLKYSERNQAMKNCIFCNFPDKEVIVYQDKSCYAIISKDPINKHHVLVIPKKHYRNFAELPPKTASHIFSIVKKLSKAVVKACKPDAVTYTFDDDFSSCGINLVPHYKFHIIPRFRKDMHLIDWSSLRVHANAGARSKFAKEVKRYFR